MQIFNDDKLFTCGDQMMEIMLRNVSSEWLRESVIQADFNETELEVFEVWRSQSFDLRKTFAALANKQLTLIVIAFPNVYRWAKKKLAQYVEELDITPHFLDDGTLSPKLSFIDYEIQPIKDTPYVAVFTSISIDKYWTKATGYPDIDKFTKVFVFKRNPSRRHPNRLTLTNDDFARKYKKAWAPHRRI